MNRRRYAKESKSPVAKTRQEIHDLLARWGCERVGILDHFTEQVVEIQFVWRSDDGDPFAARFRLSVAPDESLSTVNQREAEVRGRWRTLLYWLRGAIDAVDAGIIRPEEIFLPWTMNAQGETVAELVLPQLREISAGSAARLLGSGE